ncbi:MAG: symmetrical bis(5'-nucleosyl)-tetraphosphatase [Proteobacteria bacterium]|nr:MAG: symmetrical bis(5'-nucleosyl)-tetraphosphatase [Pseudomonadota bacterium]
MSDYVIGDVQGCYDALMALRQKINFKPDCDRLFFLGDLVNRGGQSLAVLRWVYARQANCQSVLGNHDLSLLYRYHLPKKRSKNAEFRAIFEAPDHALLMDWLRHCPLMIDLPNALLSHAGMYPFWDVETFKQKADWAAMKLQSKPNKYLKYMYGDQPDRWQDDLTKIERWRFIINSTTRMRFIDKQGRLDLKEKMAATAKPNLQAWFNYLDQTTLDKPLYFGHWSTLGLYQQGFINCLDSGCVWGGALTAVRLDDLQLIQVS